MSTRTSGEKKRPDADIVSVLADSDSFSDLNEIDLTTSDWEERRAANSIRTTEVESVRRDLPKIDDLDSSPRPKFQKKLARSPIPWIAWRIGALVIGSLVLVGGSYWIFSQQRGRLPLEPTQKTAFEVTSDAMAYSKALTELKRAFRFLEASKAGYLAKELPASALGELDELTQSYKSLVDDGFPIKEGNTLYERGEKTGASKLMIDETKKLEELKAKIKQQTDLLNSLTYPK